MKGPVAATERGNGPVTDPRALTGPAGISDQEAEGAEVKRRTGIDYGREPFAQGDGMLREGRQEREGRGEYRRLAGHGSQLGRVLDGLLEAALAGAIGRRGRRDGLAGVGRGLGAAGMGRLGGRLGCMREQGNQGTAEAGIGMATGENLGHEEDRRQRQGGRPQESSLTQAPHTPNIPQAASGT